MAIRGFLLLLGPAIGPIVGGTMVQEVNWRWLFYVLSVFDGMIVVLFILFLPETHCQTLLSRKADRLRASTGGSYHTDYEHGTLILVYQLKVALIRPNLMLITQPAIQLCSLVMGFQLGLLYIALITFSTLWTIRYKQSSTASGLHYVAIVSGCVVALQAGGGATDCVWARLKERNAGETRPEYQVPMMLPGVILIPIRLLWYGWAAERRLHWIVPDIGNVNLSVVRQELRVTLTRQVSQSSAADTSRVIWRYKHILWRLF
jgi:MFS family permease